MAELNEKQFKTLMAFQHKLNELYIKFEQYSSTRDMILELCEYSFFKDQLSRQKIFDSHFFENLRENAVKRQDMAFAKNFLFNLIKKILSRAEQEIKGINNKLAQSNFGEGDEQKLDLFIKFIHQINIFPSSELNVVIINEDEKDERLNRSEEQSKSYSFRSQENNKASSLNPNLEVLNCFFSQSALSLIDMRLRTGRMPSPEKKFLTVCFLDLVGFSTMAEDLDSIKVLEVLNSFFNQVNETIGEYDGDIDKFIGDAMLITFDRAEDAVRCSLEILAKDLEIINSKLDYMDIPDIQVHLGLNTGWVLQGNVGSKKRMETTVIGDGVNIAARIQGLSPPNELWMAASTVASLGHLKKSMEPVGRQKLKGRKKEVMIYRHSQKVAGESTVLVYEPDYDAYQNISGKLKEVGIDKIIHVKNIVEYKINVKQEKVRIVLAGTSVDTNYLSTLIHEAKEMGRDRIPILPLFKRKLSVDIFDKLEKLGIKTQIQVHKEGAMKRVNTALINEETKTIERIEEEPDPEEIMEIVSKITEDALYELEQSSEEKIDFKEVEKRIQKKLNFSVKQFDINLVLKAQLDSEELKVISFNIKNLACYVLGGKTKKIDVDLSQFDENEFKPIYIAEFMNALDPHLDELDHKIKLNFLTPAEFTAEEVFESIDRVRRLEIGDIKLTDSLNKV